MARSSAARSAARNATAPSSSAKFAQANRIVADARSRGQDAALMAAAKQHLAANGGDITDAILAVSQQAASSAAPATTPATTPAAASQAAPQAAAPAQASSKVPSFEDLAAMGQGTTAAAAPTQASNNPLAGRKLPSKKTMLGALASSGQYTPQELDAYKKGNIRDLGTEYFKYVTSVQNNPSSQLLPNPPAAGAAPTPATAATTQATTPAPAGKGRGRGRRGGRTNQQRNQARQAYQQKVQAAGGAQAQQGGAQQAAPPPQQQQATPPASPPPGAAAAPAQQGGMLARAAAALKPEQNWMGTGMNKPWWATAGEHLYRNAPGYLGTGAAYGAYRMMFPGDQDQSQRGPAGMPGRYDTPLTPQYLDAYQKRWLLPQGQSPTPQPSTPSQMLDYPDITPQGEGPMPNAMPEPEPGSMPAGAPPQSTDIIRMLMQRGQV